MNRKKSQLRSATRKRGMPARPTGVAADESPETSIASRHSAGRLGRALRTSKKREATAGNIKSRSLNRWENEGGQTNKPAARKSARDQETKPRTSKNSAKRPGKHDGRKKVPAKSPKADAGKAQPDSGDLKLSAAYQRRRFGAVKRARIRRAGITSRVLGHVSSQGRRVQAKRDSRTQARRDSLN